MYQGVTLTAVTRESYRIKFQYGLDSDAFIADLMRVIEIYKMRLGYPNVKHADNGIWQTFLLDMPGITDTFVRIGYPSEFVLRQGVCIIEAACLGVAGSGASQKERATVTYRTGGDLTIELHDGLSV